MEPVADVTTKDGMARGAGGAVGVTAGASGSAATTCPTSMAAAHAGAAGFVLGVAFAGSCAAWLLAMQRMKLQAEKS